jgi:hypothetical protein
MENKAPPAPAAAPVPDALAPAPLLFSELQPAAHKPVPSAAVSTADDFRKSRRFEGEAMGTAMG